MRLGSANLVHRFARFLDYAKRVKSNAWRKKREREKKSESQCEQWPATLANATTDGARKPPTPKCMKTRLYNKYSMICSN